VCMYVYILAIATLWCVCSRHDRYNVKSVSKHVLNFAFAFACVCVCVCVKLRNLLQQCAITIVVDVAVLLRCVTPADTCTSRG
jgi:hypothetical protein